MDGERLLTTGVAGYTLVDADYAPLLREYQWRATRGGSGHVEVAATIDGRTVRLHRLVWQMAHDMPIPQGMVVDHANRDSLDNRRGNLRLANAAQNLANQRREVPKSSSFRGVRRRGSRWVAQIQVRGRQINLGTFTMPEFAARAYDAAARKYYGAFAQLNFEE